MDELLDELFGARTPPDIDTPRLLKYFKNLERAILSGTRDLKYSECSEAIEAVDTISNEMTWLEDDFHKLVAAYEESQDALAFYQNVVMQRLTESEIYELNALRVKRVMEKANT